jgi:hypothetical protein
MITKVDGIEHFSKLMDIDIRGIPVSKDIFEEETKHLNLIRESYCNAFEYWYKKFRSKYIIGYMRKDGQYFLLEKEIKMRRD